MTSGRRFLITVIAACVLVLTMAVAIQQWCAANPKRFVVVVDRAGNGGQIRSITCETDP